MRLPHPEFSGAAVLSFLNYVDGKPPEGAFTKAFATAVEEIKEHTEMRREYMTLQMMVEEMAREREAAGWRRGREEGLEEGREEGVMYSLRHIMDSFNVTLEKAMDTLKIPPTERSKYISML